MNNNLTEAERLQIIERYQKQRLLIEMNRVISEVGQPPKPISEIELLQKRIALLDSDIDTDSSILDIVAGRLESNKAQRARAIYRIEVLLIERAIEYPSYLRLEEFEVRSIAR